MRPRHVFLQTAILLACVASTAQAQRLQDNTTPPTHVVVTFNGQYTWNANEIRWGGAQAGVVMQRKGDPATAPAGRFAGTKPPSNTVEIIAVEGSNAELNQWTHAIGAAPAEVSISVVTMSGTPAVTYQLHHAVVTKVSMNQMDAGSSQVPVTHVTLTAQSVTMNSASH